MIKFIVLENIRLLDYLSFILQDKKMRYCFYILRKKLDKINRQYQGLVPNDRSPSKANDFRTGFTLVEITLVVGLIALLAAIAIPNLLRSKLLANDAMAKSTLRAIASSLETYVSREQVYPAIFADLTSATPAYLTINYVALSPYRGYNYACGTLSVLGYSCTATPEVCSQTGTKIFTITTGGGLTEAECS